MLGIAFIVAAADWLAVGLQLKWLEYVFKPAALIAIIIGAFLLTQRPHDEWEARFLLIGLVFSLAGDVFLMLPGKGLFLPGLVSFLLAHLCYIVAFNPTPPSLPTLVLLIPVAFIGILLYRRVASGLKASGQPILLIPVAIYSFVISLMLFSAWATLGRADWITSRRVLVIAGASLFFASDAMLAWNRFVRPFGLANLCVIVTYHVGQLALAASIAR